MELVIVEFVHLIYLHLLKFSQYNKFCKIAPQQRRNTLSPFPSPSHILFSLNSTLSHSCIVALCPHIVAPFCIAAHILPAFIVLSSCVIEQSNHLYCCIVTSIVLLYFYNPTHLLCFCRVLHVLWYFVHFISTSFLITVPL